jgi:hypothetical protein
MSNPALGAMGKTFALAWMMAATAWSAQPASMIVHGAIMTPWTIEIQTGGLQKGKIKIFTKEPEFTEDMELKTPSSEYTELRSDRDGPRTYTLDWKKGAYWIIFYPKLGVLNLELKLYKGKDGPPATVSVTQGIIAKQKGVAGGIFQAGLKFLGKSSGLPVPEDISGSVTLDLTVKAGDNNLDKFNWFTENFEKFDGTSGLKQDKTNAFLMLN